MDLTNLPQAVLLAKHLKLVDDYSKTPKGERIVSITVARTPVKRAEIKKHLALNSKEETQIDAMFDELETKLAIFFEEIKVKIVNQIKTL